MEQKQLMIIEVICNHFYSKLGLKLGAYTDNDKLRFILDSRTSSNKGKRIFTSKKINSSIFKQKHSYRYCYI